MKAQSSQGIAAMASHNRVSAASSSSEDTVPVRVPRLSPYREVCQEDTVPVRVPSFLPSEEVRQEDTVPMREPRVSSYKEARQRVLCEFEYSYLASLFRLFAGNHSAASRAAGLSRRHLRTLFRKHGFPTNDPQA